MSWLKNNNDRLFECSPLRLELRDLDGLIAVPSLAEPRFMEGHYLGTRVGLLPRKNVTVHTIDTGGAGSRDPMGFAWKRSCLMGRHLDRGKITVTRCTSFVINRCSWLLTR